MRTTLIALTALTTALVATPALADHYTLDKAHTNVIFFINHLGFSDMIGKFKDIDGTFTFDQQAPEKSVIDVTIMPSSIETSSAKLDSELQNDKFFNSDKFPTIHFVSKIVKITGSNTGDVEGDLTMLGVTKPATLHVKFNKADVHPMTKDYVAGFSAETTVKRSEFGMGAYIPMVGDDVRVMIQTEGVDQDRKKATDVEKKQ
jgi:polyisoprenoid-binding protein YceI